MNKKVSTCCFIILMAFQFIMLPLTISGLTQMNNGISITINSMISQGTAVAFSTDQIEWLGAYSSNTRVTDINNDAIDDLFIGGNKMRIFFGHAGEWSNHTVDEADATLINDESGNQIGNQVGVGDVNNDGFPDVLMASAWTPVNPTAFLSERSKAYLFFGGDPNDWLVDTPISNADVTFIAEANGDFMGHGMDGVGDVNQDGYDDFVITSEFNDQAYTDAGKAYLVLGRATTAWNTSINIAEAASASFLGTETNGWLGSNAAGVGDVNNDGFDDFLISGAKYQWPPGIMGARRSRELFTGE